MADAFLFPSNRRGAPGGTPGRIFAFFLFAQKEGASRGLSDKAAIYIKPTTNGKNSPPRLEWQMKNFRKEKIKQIIHCGLSDNVAIKRKLKTNEKVKLTLPQS